MARLALIASSDDFLLEDSLDGAVAEVAADLGGVEPEHLPEDMTPEAVAVELRSPSLFTPNRLLVLADVRPWLEAPAPPGTTRAATADDIDPLVRVLEDGLPEGVALLMGAWCGRRPKGAVVDAVTAAGRFEWIPLPDPPKPWESVLLSDDQRAVLGQLLRRTAGAVRFTPGAEELLLERLGFAPRLLVQEAGKLVAAAGDGGEVDEALVRDLTFPRERSLEVVRDAVLQRHTAALIDLVGSAAAGLPVKDWRGQRFDPAGLAAVLFAQVHNLLQQLLVLRRVAETAGLGGALEEAHTITGHRYNAWFGKRIAPQIVESLGGRPSPIARGGKLPSTWTLGLLFAGAGRYREDELVAALADGGAVEVELRGQMPLEAVSAWLAAVVRPQA